MSKHSNYCFRFYYLVIKQKPLCQMTKAFKQPHIHGSGCLLVDCGVCGQRSLWKSNTYISTPPPSLGVFQNAKVTPDIRPANFMDPHWTWVLSHGTLELLISTWEHVLNLEIKGELVLTSEGIQKPTYQHTDSCRSRSFGCLTKLTFTRMQQRI